MIRLLCQTSSVVVVLVVTSLLTATAVGQVNPLSPSTPKTQPQTAGAGNAASAAARQLAEQRALMQQYREQLIAASRAAEDRGNVDQLAAWREMMLQQAQRSQAQGNQTWEQQQWSQQAQQMYGNADAWRELVYRAAIANQYRNGGGYDANTGTGWTGGVYAYPSGFYDPNVNSNYYNLQGQNGATTERYDNGGYNLQTKWGGSVISDGEGGVYVGR